MDILEGKIKAYEYLLKNEGIPVNEFSKQLINIYNETEDFWLLVRDELIGKNKISFGCGCHVNSSKQPATLLFTDKHNSKCVEIN